MKPNPAILLLLISAAAQAQIHRCESSSGQISFQDRACAEQPAATPATPAASARVAYADASGTTQGGWTHQQRWQRRAQAKAEWRVETVRLQQLLQPSRERTAMEYTDSRRRCEIAKQVESLCGTHDRPFSCDAKGFRAEAPVDAGAASVNPSIPRTRDGVHRMQQCALQFTKGH